MAYCDVVLASAQAPSAHPPSEAILSACIQAQATSDAGWMTFYAGVMAVFAALLAFGSAYVGAWKQVALQEKIYKAKRSAYHTRITHLATKLSNELHLDRGHLRGQSQASAESLLHLDSLQPARTSPAADFQPERWEEHALLGPSISEAIISVSEEVSEYNRIKTEILSRLKASNPSEISNDDITELFREANHAADVANRLCEELEASTPVKTDYAEVFALISKPMTSVAFDAAKSLIRLTIR